MKLEFNHNAEEMHDALGLNNQEYSEVLEKTRELFSQMMDCGKLSEEIELIYNSDLSKEEVAMFCGLMKRAILEKVKEVTIKQMIGDVMAKSKSDDKYEN